MHDRPGETYNPNFNLLGAIACQKTLATQLGPLNRLTYHNDLMQIKSEKKKTININQTRFVASNAIHIQMVKAGCVLKTLPYRYLNSHDLLHPKITILLPVVAFTLYSVSL